MEEFRFYESLVRRRESLICAYLLCVESKYPKSFKKLAQELLERPITTLKKGETTMVLEAQRLSDNDYLKAVEHLVGLAGQAKRGFGKSSKQGNGESKESE